VGAGGERHRRRLHAMARKRNAPAGRPPGLGRRPGVRRLARGGAASHRPRMTTQEPAGERFASFEAFYPYYIHEDSNRTCRRIQVSGSGRVLLALAAAIVTLNPWWLLAMPVIGYGFAWVGHFFFEKNRPATFRYPL